MSDLSIYELEDIIWDEFGQSEDHIVPHSSDENTKELSSPAESCKKPRFEEIGVSSNTDDKYAVECVSQEKEERDFSTVNMPNNTMLEKGSWSHTSDKMFSASCDTDRIKEVTSLASENNRMSSQCFKSKNIDSLDELCSVDPILNGRCTAVDSNSYRYPLTHISQTESDLRFNDNAHEEKESNNLLYYSWRDIENFEDVARIFRGCDSSFALGSAGKEDEVSWFSVSDAIEGSEDASKSDFKLSCPDSNALTNLSEDIEPSRLKNESSSVNDSNMKSATVSYKTSSRRSEIDEPASLSHLSSVNGYGQISECQDDFILRDQGLEFSEVQFRSSTNQSENDNRMQKQNLGPVSFDYLHNNMPYMQLDYHQPSEQTTVCPKLSGIKSENSIQTSLSQNESSHASNRVRSMKRSHDFSFDGIDMAHDEMREKLHRLQGFQPSFESNSKHVDLALICNPASVQTGNDFETHSDIEGVSIGVPAELGPLNVQESSSTNSGLNEVSLEITGFRQLQQVMEQLDIRTKLCIRDSLYRLARSAEQRHNYANLNGGPGDDRDARTFMSEGRNKCSGFMDIETDTNPIDRTIAHLLFHRPSDTSIMPSPNALSLKSQSMIPGSVSGPPVMVEKLLCQEESAAETDR